MKTHCLVILLFLVSVFMMNCGSDESTSPGDSKDGSTGTLKILLTDSPGEFDEVNITFSEVAVHFADDSSDIETPDDKEETEKSKE